MEYKVIATIPIHDLVPKVREVEDVINETLAEANVNDHVQAISEIAVMTLTVGREIERHEEAKISEMLRKELSKISGLENCAVSLRKSSGKSSV